MADSGRRNPHCTNCGDLRGGPFGHEISECTYHKGVDDPVTEDWLAELAEDRIATWMPSYTDMLDDGRQRRIVQLEDDTYTLYQVTDPSGDNPPRTFRVAVTVEEVK